MGTFSGTKRKAYTKDRVCKMRKDRKDKKPKDDRIPQNLYIHTLGDLIAAGHMKFTGFRGYDESISNGGTYMLPTYSEKQINVKYSVARDTDKSEGDYPHMTGYLTSGHPNDPNFRLKGWINEDGTIRLELVKHFELP